MHLLFIPPTKNQINFIFSLKSQQRKFVQNKKQLPMTTSASFALEITEFNFLGSLRLPIFPLWKQTEHLESARERRNLFCLKLFSYFFIWAHCAEKDEIISGIDFFNCFNIYYVRSRLDVEYFLLIHVEEVRVVLCIVDGQINSQKRVRIQEKKKL